MSPLTQGLNYRSACDYFSLHRVDLFWQTVGVGAQQTLVFWWDDFLSENICAKINKIPVFYMIFARKKYFPHILGANAPSASV